MLRPETESLFGQDPPPALKSLVEAVDEKIRQAINSPQPMQLLKARLDAANKELNAVRKELLNETYLHPRNMGGHLYPGIVADGEAFKTSDCDYCKCWMGRTRSDGPEGVDPFGECPGNPKLRDAYRLLRDKNKLDNRE